METHMVDDQDVKFVYIAKKLAGKLVDDNEDLIGLHCRKFKYNEHEIFVNFYVSIVDVLEFEDSFISYSKRPECYA